MELPVLEDLRDLLAVSYSVKDPFGSRSIRSFMGEQLPQFAFLLTGWGPISWCQSVDFCRVGFYTQNGSPNLLSSRAAKEFQSVKSA